MNDYDKVLLFFVHKSLKINLSFVYLYKLYHTTKKVVLTLLQFGSILSYVLQNCSK